MADHQGRTFGAFGPEPDALDGLRTFGTALVGHDLPAIGRGVAGSQKIGVKPADGNAQIALDGRRKRIPLAKRLDLQVQPAQFD